MSNKVLYTIVAVLIIAGLAFVLYNNQKSDTTVDSTSQSTPQINQEPANNQSQAPANSQGTQTQPPAGGQFSDETQAGGGTDVQVREIVYNGTAFTPNDLTLKVGDVVIFKNDSNKSFWPASGPHPQHTNYPEFDPKKSIAAGSTWEFKFTKAGTWPFHDHLNATAFGKITVTQ